MKPFKSNQEFSLWGLCSVLLICLAGLEGQKWDKRKLVSDWCSGERAAD